MQAEAEPTPPVTVFFVTRRTSGIARRMESLIADLQVHIRPWARIRKIDADANADFAAKIGATEVPTIVVVKKRRIVGRLTGRATMPEIERLVMPHLDTGR
jgi:thioredoxin-like negative regulator of GroEL